jgi:hypothetical protein
MKLAQDQKKTPLALMRGTVEDETRAGPEENSPRAHNVALDTAPRKAVEIRVYGNEC